jgi:hypothetical protein
MTRLIAVVTVLLAVPGSGLVVGFWNGRWGSLPAVDRAASRLERVPLSPGAEWDVRSRELSPLEVSIAELGGYLSREYIHRRTGTVVSVLLVCGRAGPICVHTPEGCYTGAGYVPAAAATRVASPGGFPGQFRVRDFRKTNVAMPTLLRIFLSWGYQGQWSAPDNPRLAFFGKPYLYKLYVIRAMSKPDEPIDQDPANELLKELMPQFQEALFTGS